MSERKFDHHHKGHLDSEERRRLLDPERIVAALPVQPDHVVADIGAGTGFFVEALARAVPAGRVVAFDSQEEMIVALGERAAGANLANVEVMSSEDLRLPVPAAEFDGAFAAFVLHETEEQRAFLREVRRVLKPGAWLAVLEFKKEATESGPPLAIRLAAEEVAELLTATGFALAGEATDVNDHQYMVLAHAV